MIKSKDIRPPWWRRHLILLIGSTSLLVLLGVFWQPIFFIVFLLTHYRCVNFPEETVWSPNHKLKAVVFFHDCGAGTRFSMGVEVLRANDKLSDGDGNACTLGEGDESYLLPRWKNNEELVIHNKSEEFWMPDQVTLWMGWQSGFTTVKLRREFPPVK